MAETDRKFVGILPGRLIPQPDPVFTETEWGFDQGIRRWLTHPDTNKADWPQRNQPDKEWQKMFVREVTPRDDESGLIELTAHYRGVMRFVAGAMKERFLPGAGISMFTLPALQSGSKVRVVAPVPKPQVTREYLTVTKPTLNGVSQAVVAAWLPGLPTFSISYVPDPDETPTVNYHQGWIMDDRKWEDIAASVYLVREFASYYYPLSV